MEPTRREIMTWQDVDRLIDHLIPQFSEEYEAMVMITREALSPGVCWQSDGITHILTAAVDFPAQMEMERPSSWPGLSSSNFQRIACCGAGAPSSWTMCGDQGGRSQPSDPRSGAAAWLTPRAPFPTLPKLVRRCPPGLLCSNTERQIISPGR